LVGLKMVLEYSARVALDASFQAPPKKERLWTTIAAKNIRVAIAVETAAGILGRRARMVARV